jgi:hypothetical protein
MTMPGGVRKDKAQTGLRISLWNLSEPVELTHCTGVKAEQWRKGFVSESRMENPVFLPFTLHCGTEGGGRNYSHCANSFSNILSFVLIKLLGGR